MEPVKVGLLGLGTVGGGVVNVLHRNVSEIARRAGREIKVTHAVAKAYDKDSISGLDQIEISTDPEALVSNPEVDIIVELFGGTDYSRTLALQAIENGKHVVTANKALIATHGNEIFSAAQKQGVMVAFEAAVAGGIPIIKTMREGLAANRIDWLAGIINGTGNFILTEMRDKGRDFADVLKEAQALGYAEADPAFDIDGTDAAHKLTILASIAFGIPLQYDKVYKEGIDKITREDVFYAEQFGYRIKHLGISKDTEYGIELRVHPTLIPERRLIANVDGVMNAVLVKGDAVGPTLQYGAGAGSDPTASAVVADLVDVVRVMSSDPENRVPHLAFQADALSETPIADMGDIKTAYYLRMNALERPGVLAEVTNILGERGISIVAIRQQDAKEGASGVPIVFLTHVVKEQAMNDAIKSIEALDSIDGAVTRIRVEHLG
ncbi:MAG: homoserine dehydrogenase [Gammaproteobacteria bacterium]